VRDEDDDTGKATVDDDPDLSLNYKKVAARWLMAKVVEALNKRQRKKEDKKRREQNPDQHKPPAPLPKPPKAPEPEAKKIKVRLKDTGQVVEVTEDTLKKEPGKYEEYKPGDEGAAPEAPGGVPSAPEDEGKKAPTAPPKPDSVEGWVAGMDEGRLDEALSGLKSQFAPSKKQNSMFGDKPDTETLDSPLAVQVLAGLKIPGGLFKTVGDVRAFLKNKKLHGTVGTGKAPAAEAPAPKAPPATPAAPATPATPEAPAAAPDEEKATPERQKAQEALDKLGEALAEGGPWGKDEELDDSDPLTDPHVMEKLKELGVEIPEAVAKGLKTLGGLRKALKNPKKITRDWARAIAAPKPVDEAEQLRGQFGETVKGLTEAHPELAESLSGMSDADKAAASAAFSTRMRSLRGTYQQSGLTPDLLKAARAGSSPGAIKNTATPAARGEALAAYRFAHAVLADPSLVGGQPISDEPKDETALQKRAEAAYEQYRTLGPELRQSAIEMAAKQMRELDRNSPRFRELNRVVDGLALAHMPESLFVGDRLIREPPSPAFSTLVARLNEKDTVGLLLRPTESLNSPSGREVLQDAVGTLSDEELIGLHGGESGPFRGLFSDEDEGEGWEDLPSGYKEIFRGLMREWAVRDMTIGHACFMSGARRSKAKKPRDIREFVDKCHREVEGHPDVKKDLDATTECMKKAVTQEDLEGCKKAEAEADKAQLAAYIDVRKRHFGEIPDDDPVAAKIRRVIETGDVTELEKKYIRERDRHREQFVGWDEGGDDEYGSPWFSGGSDHDFD